VAKERARRSRRSGLVRRGVLAGALLLAAFLYYRPITTYLDTKDALRERRLEVAALRQEKRVLEQRLAGSAGDASLLRSARRLGLVKPGERLFIVKGIEEWKRKHGPAAPRG
jgi:hypothetical protein